LGKTIREFRKASSDVEDAVRIEPAAAPATAKPVNTIADTTDTAAEDRTAS
jgi:Sec-independent protein translocase protein TatA